MSRQIITHYLTVNRHQNLFITKQKKTAMVQDNPSVIISPSSRADDKDIGAYIRFRLTIRDVATGQTRQGVLECSPDLSYRTAG